MASAFGFALAYYFDVEHGAARRRQLHQTAQRAFRQINGALAPDVGDPPVFSPILRERTDLRPVAARASAAAR